LSRQKTEKKTTEKAKESRIPEYQLQQVWNIAENTGRRYAKVSGDFNLIHIHAVTAKAFGFKQAIAHGMWSKAKALANINLRDAYEADVWFKLPMYLPSKVEFLTAEQPKETDFLIRNEKSKTACFRDGQRFVNFKARSIRAFYIKTKRGNKNERFNRNFICR
jgi:hypothetical protein